MVTTKVNAESAARRTRTKSAGPGLQDPAGPSGPAGHTPSVVCGAAARTAAQLAIYPIDTVKTRKQVSSTLPHLQRWKDAVAHSRIDISLPSTSAPTAAPALVAATAAPALGAAVSSRPPAPPRRLGPLSFPISNWAALGPADLYRGAAGSLATIAAASLTFFLVDSTVKQLIRARLHQGSSSTDGHEHPPSFALDVMTHVLSSSAACFTSAFIKVPSDVLKHKVQAYAYPNVRAAAHGILTQGQGIKGMFAGFQATLMRDVPEAALQFTAYAQLRRTFCPNPSAPLGPSPASPSPARSAQHLLLGGASGVLASVATTPLDVLKTKMQCDGCGCLVRAAREAVGGGRGAAGLFAGAGPRVLMTGLNSALFFAFFEAAQAEAARRCPPLDQPQAAGDPGNPGARRPVPEPAASMRQPPHLSQPRGQHSNAGQHDAHALGQALDAAELKFRFEELVQAL